MNNKLNQRKKRKSQFHCGFNLADDFIEPWRAMVDIVAHDIVSSQTNLNREQRKQFCNMSLYQFEEDFQEEIVGINDFIAL